MNISPVLAAFTYTGKTYTSVLYDDDVTEVNYSDYKFIYVFPTEEEVKEYAEIIREEQKIHPKLIGTEYFINKFRDTKLMKENPEYPDNFVKAIKEESTKNVIVLVSHKEEVRKILLDNNIKFDTVLPEENLLAEYIGRMYLDGKPKIEIDQLIKSWFIDVVIKGIDPTSKIFGNKIIRLQHDQFIYDLLHLSNVAL